MIRGGGFSTHLSFSSDGYQERFDPDKPSFDLTAGVNQLLAEFEEFPPDVVVCASRGGTYMRELWRRLEARRDDCRCKTWLRTLNICAKGWLLFCQTSSDLVMAA
jgi:hypothetical protein